MQDVEQVMEDLAAGLGYPRLAAALQHGADIFCDGLGEVLFVHDVAGPDIVEALGGELGFAPVLHLPVHARHAVQELVDLGVFDSLGFVVHGGDFRSEPAAQDGREAYAAAYVEAVLALYVFLNFGKPAGEGVGRGPYLVPVGQAVFLSFLFGHAFPQLVHIGAAEMPYISTGLEYAVEGSVGFHVVSFWGFCRMQGSITAEGRGVKPRRLRMGSGNASFFSTSLPVRGVFWHLPENGIADIMPFDLFSGGMPPDEAGISGASAQL